MLVVKSGPGYSAFVFRKVYTKEIILCLCLFMGSLFIFYAQGK